MPRVELKNISHSYELGYCEVLPADCDMSSGFVIKDLDLTWEDGTANALLGPSGCGKTTILNIVSGLLRPTMGSILFDGKDVTALSPMKRHLAQVFQFPVVYDTMSVFDNLAFPLKNSGVSKDKIRKRVEEIAEILELTPLLRVSSGRITQAEKQKVSLGRGIVREDTAVILLDEPLTVIDPKEKYILQRKLREVQRKLKITMIYVTHDQHEALTFADYVAVMKDGVVVQNGTPADLHSEPQSPFIGYFIGSPGMNLLECSMKGNDLDLHGFHLRISPEMKAKLDRSISPFQFGIRPEFVEPGREQKEDSIPMNVNLIENMGAYKILNLTSNGIRIKSRLPATEKVSVGDRLWVGFPEDKIKIFKDNKRVF
jgi:glycerol transport system ATP-binding protein